MMNSIITERF